MKHQQKDFSRLEARISINLHEKIKLIAKYKHLTVSSFITPILEQVADKELQKIENQLIINLSIRDQHNFAKAILSEEVPNKALKKAFKLHGKENSERNTNNKISKKI